MQVSYLTVRFLAQQLAVNTCPNVSVKRGLLAYALFSIFHEDHLWWIIVKSNSHKTLHFDVAFLQALKHLLWCGAYADGRVKINKTLKTHYTRSCCFCSNSWLCQILSIPDSEIHIRSWMSSVQQSDTTSRMCVHGIRPSQGNARYI